MKWGSVLVTSVLLTSWCIQLVVSDFVASDEHLDVDHDADVHPNAFREATADVQDVNTQTSRDVPDMNIETNWDTLDINPDNYGDADWHPPASVLETHSDLFPDTPPAVRGGHPSVGSSTNRTSNKTKGSSSAQCGEYSSRLMSNGQCRLTAMLPQVGTSQKRCPDIFRCTDNVSDWLHENQNRKEQLGELGETMSQVQEELRNHQHRVKTLEIQVDLR